MTENRDVAFSRLVDLLDTLRGPQGCPWDREQTHDSLKRYLLEESHEVFEVIDHNPEKLPEELGDVLLQVLFHAQIAAEEGRFTIDDVLESLRDKLVRRHPHVFGEQKVRDAREVEANWEELKRGERAGQPDVSLLGSVPQAMPALANSQLVQERAARSGFDWEQIDGVLDKVAEEVREIKEARSQEERARELGDLLFSMVNAARWMGIQSEDALRQASARFRSRFLEMERLAGERSLDFTGLSLHEKDLLWNEAKASQGKG